MFSTFCLSLFFITSLANASNKTNCKSLKKGQYICPHPDYDLIDPKTQQPRGCTTDNLAEGERYYIVFLLIVSKFTYKLILFAVQCLAADGIICNETDRSDFTITIPCKWT